MLVRPLSRCRYKGRRHVSRHGWARGTRPVSPTLFEDPPASVGTYMQIAGNCWATRKPAIVIVSLLPTRVPQPPMLDLYFLLCSPLARRRRSLSWPWRMSFRHRCHASCIVQRCLFYSLHYVLIIIVRNQYDVHQGLFHQEYLLCDLALLVRIRTQL